MQTSTLSRLYWRVQRYCGISQQYVHGWAVLGQCRSSEAVCRGTLRPEGAVLISRLCATGFEKGVPFPAVCALIWLIGTALNRQTI